MMLEEKSSPRVVWVTGAAGYIGRYLCATLRQRGFHVIGFGGSKRPKLWDFLPSPAIRWYPFDTTLGVLMDAVRLAGRPDVVFHLAGSGTVAAAEADYVRAEEACIGSLANVMSALNRAGSQTRLILASSAAVYGNVSEPGPILETTRLQPISKYGELKVAMEKFARAEGNEELEVVALRIFSVFGIGLQKQILWDACERLARGDDYRFSGTGGELRDFVNIDDCTDVMCACANERELHHSVYNIGSGCGTSLHWLLNEIKEHWGDKKNLVPLQFSGQCSENNPNSLIANVERIGTFTKRPRQISSHDIKAYCDWVVKR